MTEYWNESCLLTRLPIQSSKAVIFFLIAQKPNTGKLRRAENLFTPVTLPIFGRYNGRGGLQELEDPGNSLQLLQNIKFYTKANGWFVEHTIEYPTAPLFFQTVESTPEAQQKAHNERFAKELIRQTVLGELYIALNNGPAQIIYSQVYPIFMLREFYNFAINTKQHVYTGASAAMLYACAKELTKNLPKLTIDMPPGTNINEQHKLIRDLVRLNEFMTDMRITWAPITGFESQANLEDPKQADFYDLMANRAGNIHLSNRPD